MMQAKLDHIEKLSLIKTEYYIVCPKHNDKTLELTVRNKSLGFIIDAVNKTMAEKPIDASFIRDDQGRTLFMYLDKRGWTSAIDVHELFKTPYGLEQIANNPKAQLSKRLNDELMAEIAGKQPRTGIEGALYELDRRNNLPFLREEDE